MPPFWPFKRSKKNDDEIDEAPPEPVVYRKGQEVHSEKHSASPERDDRAYKDALALFGSGDTTVSASTNLAEEYDGVVNQATQPTESTEEETFEWVHHTDGYHYKKKLMVNSNQHPTSKMVMVHTRPLLNQSKSVRNFWMSCGPLAEVLLTSRPTG